jgi:tetratricopeptide (TPR) repeat protein
LLVAPVFSGELPKGRIVEKVVCAADARQSYALYLPSAYDAARAWPIVYCFDPGARGRVAVQQFREGAERYGYVVAGSYNSQNGPVAPSLEALRAMWLDTHRTLSLDDRRIYLAGMSGGARTATGFLETGFFAGVIAESAGFPQAETPKNFALPLFGTAGADDFNYAEMRLLDRELEARGSPHRVVVFPGTHGWAPPSVCAAALGWLDLAAMRAGTKPLDAALIHALFLNDIAGAQAAEQAHDIIAAYARNRWLAADYKGWEDTAPFERRVAELRESKEYRKALKAEDRAAIEQHDLTEKILSLARQLAAPGREEAASALDDAAADLRRRAHAARDSEDRRLARRAQLDAIAWEREESWDRVGKKDYAAAAGSLEIALKLDPDNPEVLYSLASVYALENDQGRAVAALKRAVAKGFRDFPRLERDPSFDSVRGREDFRTLAAGSAR